jgi:hypothetical protein
MQSLLPFRAWKFKDGDSSPIELLKNPERKPDDRSPFVRYARSAALWAEWVREGLVIQDEEASIPVLEAGGFSFRFGIVPIQTLSPLTSVLPSAKEHGQRLLEGIQLYTDPIVVVSKGDSYKVVGNHELFESARSYQADVARPGKVRASDYCLVALADEGYLDSIQPQPLIYNSKLANEVISANLQSAGYKPEARADDPTKIAITLEDGKILAKHMETGGQWKQDLAETIGVRTLDLSFKNLSEVLNIAGTKIVFSSPKVMQEILNIGTELPFGSVFANIVPPSGVTMWSLKDFRIE